MTHHYDNLATISTLGRYQWRNWHDLNYGVTVGAYPFEVRFIAVVDEFGNLVPVRKFA